MKRRLRERAANDGRSEFDLAMDDRKILITSRRRFLLCAVIFFSCFLFVFSSKNVQERKSDTDKTRRPLHADRRSNVSSSSASVTQLPHQLTGGDQSTPSSSSSSSSSRVEVLQKKRRLIHGSKKAATITRKEYLKKDWCKTEPFEQVVEEDGCIKKRVTNRFCYGQCNSFFIPKADKQDDASSSFQSCAYCTPKVVDWMVVVLRCPNRHPPVKRKRIQIIKQCKCMAVKLEPTGGQL